MQAEYTKELRDQLNKELDAGIQKTWMMVFYLGDDVDAFTFTRAYGQADAFIQVSRLNLLPPSPDGKMGKCFAFCVPDEMAKSIDPKVFDMRIDEKIAIALDLKDKYDLAVQTCEKMMTQLGLAHL